MLTATSAPPNASAVPPWCPVDYAGNARGQPNPPQPPKSTITTLGKALFSCGAKRSID